jgi:hypothetical protein
MSGPSAPSPEPRDNSVRRAPGLRARLRALAIAVALLVQCTRATPQRPLTPEQLARPEGQRALLAIDAALSLVDLHPSRGVLESELIEWTRRALSLRAAVLSPFEPLVRVAGLDQRVALFTGTTRETHRLHVDGRGGGAGWVARHRAPGGEDALSGRLRYRRIRGIYNPSAREGAGPEYGGFTRWLARELLVADAKTDAIRVRMERLWVGEPGTEPKGLRYEYGVVHRRAELLRGDR